VRKLLGALAVAALVAYLLTPQPAFAVPRGRVKVSKELVVCSDTLMEVTVLGPAEAVEGDTANVTITLRTIRPLRVWYLNVNLLTISVYKYDDKLYYGGWLPFTTIKVLEDTDVPGGWSTTIEREVKFEEWGDVVVEVELFAWYTDRKGEYKEASVKVHLPLTKVETALMFKTEQYRNLYESLRLNYSILLSDYTILLWRYEQLNKSYANLEKDYIELARKYSSLYWNYTQLLDDYKALKSEPKFYITFAAAALLAAAGVAAYGWLKAARAGKAPQRATKPAAQEAEGG
jgi:hypothetical protein